VLFHEHRETGHTRQEYDGFALKGVCSISVVVGFPGKTSISIRVQKNSVWPDIRKMRRVKA
jgi:hypothetical protein